MSKLKMPLPYLSHSAFSLFNRDPMGYYEQYFVARVQEQRDPLTLGTIFQEAWRDPKYNYVRALHEAGFNGDKTRAIKTAIEHHATVKLPKAKTEKSVRTIGMGLEYQILAQFDGLDTEAHLIIENKFGVPWDQKRVDRGMFFAEDGKQYRDRQLTWYMLVYFIKYGKMPKLLLQSFNVKNGTPRKFWATRTKRELELLVDDINNMVTKVQAGDFNKYV